MSTVDPQAGFELTQEGADALSALLPTCKYAVGIRSNETGEVRFCPQHTEWIDDLDGGIAPTSWWWSTGNMGCDCNRHLEFCRAGDAEEAGIDIDDVKCSDERFTVVGIWLPDGEDIRDIFLLNDF